MGRVPGFVRGDQFAVQVGNREALAQALPEVGRPDKQFLDGRIAGGAGCGGEKFRRIPRNVDECRLLCARGRAE